MSPRQTSVEPPYAPDGITCPPQGQRKPGLMPAGGAFHAALHLFLGNILYMGGHIPVVSAHVTDATAAVAVELVLRLGDRGRAGGKGAGVGGIDVLQVEVQGGGHGPK